jgi:hypothetical protein
MLSRLSVFVLEILPWALAGVIAAVLVVGHVAPQAGRGPSRTMATSPIQLASSLDPAR